MQLQHRRFQLKLAQPWRIARSASPLGIGEFSLVLLELRDAGGRLGRGETAPSRHYGETPDSVGQFLQRVNPTRLSFHDVPGSRAYLDTLSPGDHAAKAAVEVALVDGAARLARQPAHAWLGVPFTEGRHVTSFSIGIAEPDLIRQKVADAAEHPILKLKLGAGEEADRRMLAALRAVAPEKTVRVDANEAWADCELAARQLDWLAADGRVEFVEQPLPAGARPEDQAWLKARSPLPLIADESCRLAGDVAACSPFFHGINVKLVKIGGLLAARAALREARALGLRTMFGCMLESSLLISAAAHLAGLCDYLDLDGHLLAANDPFVGVGVREGVLSFATAPDPWGLQVIPRPGI
jgi:L-alanine-DL-glutamate epimerase-like enolase superfamily enzyme